MALGAWWERVKAWWAPDVPPTVLLEPYPVHERDCPRCGRRVAIWRTFADGTISCVACDGSGAA